MSNVSRSIMRKRKHSVSKVLFKINKQFHDLKDKTKCSDAEAWAKIVGDLSHKNLRIINFDSTDFAELPAFDHMISLAQSALFERAMGNSKIDLENDREQHS